MLLDDFEVNCIAAREAGWTAVRFEQTEQTIAELDAILAARGAPRAWARPAAGSAWPMDILLYLVLLAVSGLVVGALARLALPGKDPMSIPQTILIGMAGSFLAGLVAYLVAGEGSGAGIVLSVLFATGLVYLVRRRRGGSLTRPGLSGNRR